jgi:hypothetical protein
METKRIETKPSTHRKGQPNRDPITGEPGAHPVAVGIGAAGGAVAGAAIGGVAGPIGMGVGAAVGAISGGAVGKNVAETFDPTAEHEYWRTEFEKRPYFTKGTPYDQYGPAFQFGWESCAKHKGKTFTDVESVLARDWDRCRAQSKLSWNHAKAATRDAWQRVENMACGDSSNCE